MSQFQIMMAGGGGGDTTFTKIFVGGLAWETKRDTMRLYFEQFGEILEVVVITDKNTGRSKGYGFVTFKDPESAMRACQNPAPVIDGRRANCNIASFGATKPQHFSGVARTRPPAAYYHGAGGSSLFHHHQQQPQPSAQPTFPYSSLGYTGYTTQNSMYPLKYYNMYGGHHQFTLPYYTATGGGGYYPLYAAQNYRQPSPSSHGNYGGIQYTVPPQMVQHYPYSSYLPAAQLYYGSTDNILSTTTTNIAATTTFAVPIAATTTTTTSVIVTGENSHAKKKLAEEEEEE